MSRKYHEIKDFIQTIKEQKIAGCNVTVPFKKTVIPFLDKLSPEAEHTQSVNTITFDNGDLVGHNTDIAGFDAAIKKLNFNVKDKKVLILGAGGVVPSIIFALKKMDVSQIILSNRTKQNAENLKILFNNLNVIEWGILPEIDIIINATSLGLNKETLNLDFSKVGKNKFFYDVIYKPYENNFFQAGNQEGNIFENGLSMFLYQAQKAFNIWHNIEPIIDDELVKFLNS